MQRSPGRNVKTECSTGAKWRSRAAAFTLVEFLMALVIMVTIGSFALANFGTLTFWGQEAFIRKVSETLTFLHNQAVIDQTFYKIEFDFEKRQYKIGALKPEEADETLAEYSSSIGRLSLELASNLNPSLGETYTFIPSPSLPSLHDPVDFPEDVILSDVRTTRGLEQAGGTEKPYILFSPRGYSEFAVIHFLFGEDLPITILLNPFTGTTEVFREYKDFEWSYGRNSPS